MHTKYHCDSISSLPSTEKIASNEPLKFKITLPVYCLSLFKSPTWKLNAPGILYVTDFTTNENTTVHKNVLPQNVDINFFINKHVKSDKVLSIGVPAHLMDKVSRELSRTNLAMQDYNFSAPDNCQFEQEGAFARVVFILKLYRGAIEGSLIALVTLDKDNIPIFYEEDPRLDKLVSRYIEYSSPTIMNNIAPHFPIESFKSASNKRSSEEESKAPFLSNLPPSKVQKVPNGINLAFHQHTNFDDSQRPITSTQQYSSDDVPPSSFHSTQVTQGSGFVPASFDDFLVNRVTVDQVLKLPMTPEEIKKGTVFEVDAYMKGMIPYDTFIVKPFRRTLKVTPFKLVLSDNLPNSALSAVNSLVLEFNTEQEICNFLLVGEIEEVYDRIVHIETMVQKLISSTSIVKNLKIKRTVTLVDKFLRPYWTCSNTLNDLIN